MVCPDLMLLYSEKEKEWKDCLSSQLENNSSEKMLIASEPLEKLTWPLPPDKKRNFSDARVVLVILSQALLDFLKQNAHHVSEIGSLLIPERTIGVFFNIQKTDFNLSHKAVLVSSDEWLLTDRSDAEKVARIVQALLAKSEKKKRRLKRSFKLMPRKVQEGAGKVLIILNKPLQEDQELKVFFNDAESSEIPVEKLNPYNSQFIIPDSYMRSSSVLKVSVCCQEDTFGTQIVKCESRLSHLYSLLTSSCSPAELMCDAMGVNSYSALDRLLAQTFRKRFPIEELINLCIDEDVIKWTQAAEEEIPTLLHFAARYGLKQLTYELMKCPGAFSACHRKNVRGMTPAELALYFKNYDLANILINFQEAKCSIMKSTSVCDSIPSVHDTPIFSSSVSNDAVKSSEFNNYDIPPAQAVPVSHFDYDYIDEQLPHTVAEEHVTVACSESSNSESAFSQSQSKLIDIMEAYKKGASLIEVLKMHDEWKATYRIPDSEAKSTLENLRNLYASAQKNKLKSNKKQSASFLEFKHLFKFRLRRRSSSDAQDLGSDTSSNDTCSKEKSDLESHNGRLSSTFSTTSNASSSSGSSSDRWSVTSEHSDYHDYITSYKKNRSGRNLGMRNSPFSSRNGLEHKQNPAPLPHISTTYTFEGGIPDSNLINNHNVHNKLAALSNHGKTKQNSVIVKDLPSNQDNNTEYDMVPFPIPLIQQQTCTSSQNKANSQNCVPSYLADYAIPKPVYSVQIENAMNSVPAYSNYSYPNASAKHVNASVQNLYTNINCNLNHEGSCDQLIYGNICAKEVTLRRSSIPDEIAPVPPTIEEEEYYKCVGTPIPVESTK